MSHRSSRRRSICSSPLVLVLAAALAGLAAAGCGDDPVEPPPVPTTITISPRAATLQSLTETVQLTATVQDQNGQAMTDVTVTWTSRNNQVATVDNNGLATAAGNGMAIVEAMVGTVGGTAEVTVEQQPTEVRLSPATDTLMALGDTVRLSAEAFDANGHLVAGTDFTWASEDEAVVTVNAGGLVTAVGNGEAGVTASAGPVAGESAVTVEQRPAEVRISPGADTLMALGDTVRLSAEAFDANGHLVAGTDFTWASEDEAVVTVDAGGLVTAVGPGGARVAATTAEVTGSAAVTVEQRPAEVRISPGADTLMALGDTVRLSAEAFDANGHLVAGTDFTWASEDEAVVTVDAGGLVTAVGNGEASVTASAGPVAGESAVTVEQRPAEVRISPGADTLMALGDTVRLSAEAFDANGHLVAGTDFTWASEDEAVVTVDAGGLVTAVGNGEAGVTASAGPVAGESAVTVEQRPAEVRISPGADTLVAIGDTVRLSAEALDANGHPVAGTDFTWASEDEAVVTVDAGGLVTAVGNGEAGVTASAGPVAGESAVTVEQRPAEVRISPGADTLMAIGDTVRLSAEAFDANGHLVAGTDFTWASEDEAVVTVDAGGLVTAVGNGEAGVTASAGPVAGESAVTVEQRPAEVRISPGADTLVAWIGDTVRLSAEALDANGHPVAGTDFTWASEDEAVVTVDAGGLVTAVGNGEAGVTASAGPVAGESAVTVEQRPAEVRISPGADTLVAIGDTVRLSAEALDANGHSVAGTDFTWASEDEAVVTVDTGGLVTAVGNGEASVTASVGSVAGESVVTVEQRPAEVRLSPAADTLVALGDTVRLSAEALDANGHVVPDTEFTWLSGDTSIVAVDSTALVTAVTNGSAEVTASAGEVVGRAMMTVAQRAVEMRVWPEADTLLAEDTLRLSAEAKDANGHLLTHPEFTWSSGDESVATVDAGGLVTGVAAGSVEMKVVEGTAGLTRTVLLFVVDPREELARVYDALGGGGWANSENWGTDAPLDEWYGVTTDGEGHITELDLSDNGLSGAIPPELARIESLEVLDLSENGSMAPSPSPRAHDPREMVPEFLVPGAEHLPVAAFPSAAGAPDLHMMPDRPVALALQQPETDPCYPIRIVAGAGVTGSIPTELGALRRLKVLDLSQNSLTGSIPAELGNIESLEVLDLGYNSLTGSIPAELGNLGNLEVLNICVQQHDGTQRVGPGLTGSIPAELGDLESLEVLDLGYNSLTGSIPAELGDLGSLRYLYLHSNQLTGSIPAELGNLGSLRSLDLSRNSLTGSLPAELGNLESLQVLSLANNSLTGSIPAELGNLESLRFLFLSGNQLTGSIPAELGDLGNLQRLYLSYNSLTGSIPAELGNLGSLWFLYLATTS